MKPAVDKRRTSDLPRRVLFLNDVGFQYGAGIAQSRQVECIMGLGIETGVLTWAHGEISLEKVATRMIDPDLWLGIRQINYLEGGKDFSDEAVVAGLVLEVARFNPEVIIVGNLHAARWSLNVLPALRRIGCRVLTFLHDAYLFTGRCAYPGGCTLYLNGCNDTCPTATQYPALEPSRIAGAWQLRRDIFGGPHGVEIIANSLWNKKMFRTAMPASEHIETIELSANEDVFRAGDSHEARRLLGVPDDKPVVLCAAVNFQEARKGCAYLREIVAALKDEVTFVAFGHNADEIPGLLGLGYHLAPDKLGLIYQTADIFLSTATEEAFGQTVMEAQLCGVPVVAFQVGGVEEIVRNEITGKLVPAGDSVGAVAAIRLLLSDDRLRAVAGPWSRQLALARFNMWHQEQRWHAYLTGRLRHGTGHNPPTLSYPYLRAEDTVNSERHRPSWPVAGAGPFISEEHAGIFANTSGLPGWQTPGDSFKLYEMGYHAGDVILEIGTFGGRSATVELRGALANPARTEPPRFYGIDIMNDSITRTRQTISGEMLGQYCHLFHGVLQEFVQRWTIEPTMVFLDGDHSYEGCKADLDILSQYLKVGTPILVHDFLNSENDSGKMGVRQAAEEWEAAGQGKHLGCFGCCALYVTLTGRP